MLMLLRRMTQPDLTVHGFRSTFKDWCSEQTAYPNEMSEMALAQSYQDLTGQIIRRVAGIVRRVHEGFGALGLPPPEKNRDKPSELAGPAVAGLDRNAFSQDDADDLLSGLGL